MSEIEVGGYIIEWDDKKYEINIKKHGVYFEDAARIFLDEYRYDDFDEIHSNFEDRIKTVGFVMNVLAVIYTERGDRTRIISARRADRDEETEYFGQFKQ